jgi:hypothetical protein
LARLRARGAAAVPTAVWPYLLPGAYLLLTLIGVTMMFRRGFRRFLGFLGFLFFLPMAVDELPFLKSPSDPYQGNPGVKPYQALIDSAVHAGGIALWAHQGSLLQTQNLGPITLETPPHPAVLLQTKGYSAFDAIYEDNFVASKPGKQWDLVLEDFLRGKRESPVWAYGGVDFHSRSELNGRKRISDIQTVFFLKKRNRKEILKALQQGRMYVVRGYGPARLQLDQFSVVSKDAGLMAVSGESIISKTPPEVRLEISTEDGSTQDLTVQLIRNGRVIQTFRGETPYRTQYTDSDPAARGKMYYRVDAKVSRSEHLLTNPIFVTRP